jgi:hypothetical protein
MKGENTMRTSSAIDIIKKERKEIEEILKNMESRDKRLEDMTLEDRQNLDADIAEAVCRAWDFTERR